MKKVFLSHSSKDKPLVRQIRKALLPFNNFLWIDELEILPGDSLIKKLSTAMSESVKVIAFISKNSVDSDWVRRELNYFISEEISSDEPRIIPILIDSTPAPPFLREKLYIEFDTKVFGSCLAKILQGIIRKHSVFVVTPNIDNPFELVTFVDEIEEFKNEGLEGNFFLVYDCYDFMSNVISSLNDDKYGSSGKLSIALPYCIDFLCSITPKIIKTVLTYYRNDVGASHTAEKTIKMIWRFIILTIFNLISDKVDETKLSERNFRIYKNGLTEVSRLLSIKSEYIPNNYEPGFLSLAWLEYHDMHMNSTYDIGFRGTITKEGIRIDDAGHVRIPKKYIREDSLTVFRDTTPDSEFLPFVWVGYVLPYIVSDAILHYSFSGSKPSEVIQKIGLGKNDFNYFGIE